MSIYISGKPVNDDSPTLIIAEAGINHDGKIEQAFKLIDVAAAAGADVVKFQLFTASHMYPKTAGLYKTANGEDAEIYSLIKDMELPETWIPRLIEKCTESGVGFLCTTCDEASTDLLSKYNVDSYKIASSEITYLPLLKHTAQYGKTIILSEGASNISEIATAIASIKEVGNDNIVLMHCTAEYPAKLEDCNVNVIETYRRLFPDLIIGFSDHTMEPSDAPIQAVLKGAKVIEKHITLDRNLPGADHCFALEPDQLKKLVDDIRYAERHISTIREDSIIGGKTDKDVLPAEESLRKFVHRGIFASKDLQKGDVLTKENMVILRPGNSENGIEPKYIDMLVDLKVKLNKDIKSNYPVKWEDILNI